jgi:kynurenine formamidase
MSAAIETFTRGRVTTTLVDLSDRVSNETAGHEPNAHHITYVDHAQTPAMYEGALGIPTDVWPDGRMAAVESVTLSSHTGTHVDAPYHYGPESAGAAALTIDRVPLSWCFGRGVLLDFSSLPAGAGIDADDVARALAEVGHRLEPYDIVLVRTDASRHFAEPGYENRHAGLRRTAVAYLVERGVRLIGIDAWGLDRPFDVMAAEAREGDVEQLWEAHFYGKEHPYCQIEKLCNLDALPRPTGFRVIAFPVKLERASAAWARVVAVYEEQAPLAGTASPAARR